LEKKERDRMEKKEREHCKVKGKCFIGLKRRERKIMNELASVNVSSKIYG